MPYKYLAVVEVTDYWDEEAPEGWTREQVMGSVLDSAFEHQDGFFAKVIGPVWSEYYEED